MDLGDSTELVFFRAASPILLDSSKRLNAVHEHRSFRARNDLAMSLLRHDAQRDGELDDTLWLSGKLREEPKRALRFANLLAETEASNVMEVPYHKGPTKRAAPLRKGGRARTIYVSRPAKSMDGDSTSTEYRVAGEITVGELKYKVQQKEGIGAHLQQAPRALLAD